MDMENAKKLWSLLTPYCKKRLFNNNFIVFYSVVRTLDIQINEDYFDVELIDCQSVDTFIGSLIKSLNGRQHDIDMDGYIVEKAIREIDYVEKTKNTVLGIIEKVDILDDLLNDVKELRANVANINMRTVDYVLNHVLKTAGLSS